MIQVVVAVAWAKAGAIAAEDDGAPNPGTVGDVAVAGFIRALGYSDSGEEGKDDAVSMHDCRVSLLEGFRCLKLSRM